MELLGTLIRLQMQKIPAPAEAKAGSEWVDGLILRAVIALG
ncbi:hypothetical protein SAMN03159371_05244 [Variovorax sp. NFACC28]|nr:hypothetical protein SAMN03159371_05244 [Variovorax sp. NFACC28]SEG89759.1 hypothetical protein SAMN03159365_05203 [Variovorax sp. NFACC29]SFD39721.1 hypothetical protein SAMN03159379_05134 [Variovorax sp. NFACC26]SFG42116.1 hypothetical protein SAMN03159447_03244 [Variovorax sp. NFACC27]